MIWVNAIICIRILGTFNQHLPMILSNNYRSEVLYKQAKVALDSLGIKAAHGCKKSPSTLTLKIIREKPPSSTLRSYFIAIACGFFHGPFGKPLGGTLNTCVQYKWILFLAPSIHDSIMGRWCWERDSFVLLYNCRQGDRLCVHRFCNIKKYWMKCMMRLVHLEKRT